MSLRIHQAQRLQEDGVPPFASSFFGGAFQVAHRSCRACSVADGIIVSRGNLGLDFEPEVGSERLQAQGSGLGLPLPTS